MILLHEKDGSECVSNHPFIHYFKCNRLTFERIGFPLPMASLILLLRRL